MNWAFEQSIYLKQAWLVLCYTGCNTVRGKSVSPVSTLINNRLVSGRICGVILLWQVDVASAESCLVLHMRESGPVRKVRLPQMCLFKNTLNMNDCVIAAGSPSDLCMQSHLYEMVCIGWR